MKDVVPGSNHRRLGILTPVGGVTSHSSGNPMRVGVTVSGVPSKVAERLKDEFSVNMSWWNCPNAGWVTNAAVIAIPKGASVESLKRRTTRLVFMRI